MKKEDLFKMIDGLRNGTIKDLSKVLLKGYFGFNGRVIEYKFCLSPIISRKFDGSYFTILLKIILN